MKKSIVLIVATIIIMAGAVSADTVITQEVASVRWYVKGSTTLKLSGTLNDAAMDALSKGEEVSIQNSFTNYLCAPTLLDKNDKGYAKKAGTQNISAKSKNGKFSWTEKDAANNFAFAIGSETIKPTQATLKSSGTLQTECFTEFETKMATLFDILNFGTYAFFPEKKGENFKYSAKEQNVQVKFSANSKGKANLLYKFSPAVVSPAVINENVYVDPFSVTNKLYLVIDLLSETNVISYLDDVPKGGWTEEYKTTKLVLRRIEPGTFSMGSPEDELGRYDDETQHQVTLTNAYYIGVFETTQKQYELITGFDPSEYKGGARPVECVHYYEIRGDRKGASWPYNNDVDGNSFFGKLRAKIGLIFDLPTEAQWEYACRAGTTTALNSGKNLTNEDHCPNMDVVGRNWYNGGGDKYDNGEYKAHTKVGSYKPNAWGLYDMHGNVYEWCLDWYKSNLGSGSVTDPKGPGYGRFRVLRGGSWGSSAHGCRSADRYPGDGDTHRGFRVVLVQNVFSGPDNQIQKNFEFDIPSGTENTLPVFKVKLYGKTKDGKEYLLEEIGKLEYDGASGIVLGKGQHKLTWIPDVAYTNIADEVELRVDYEDVTSQAKYLVLDLPSNKMRTSTSAPNISSDKCRVEELWMRRIEPGSFTMGSPSDELGKGSHETQHWVTLTKAYYIGVFEMTQKQCELLADCNPSYYQGETRPVECSYEMIRGANKGSRWPLNYEVDENSVLGRMRKKAGNVFDLPTEAQWEYACRAGTTTALNDGNNITNIYSDGCLAKLARYWYNRNDGKGGYSEHTKVGSYLPNAWGLYDMHGNVYEWCLDWDNWYKSNLGSGSVTDPKGPDYGSFHVLRGGSWDYGGASCCRSAYHDYDYPYEANYDYGFRVVLVQ